MTVQVDTLIAKNTQLDPMHVDMDPKLESILALEPPFSFHLIGTFEDTNGKYQQLHVGLGVTRAMHDVFRERMETWPIPWEHTIIIWTPLEDADEPSPAPIADISGRLAPGEIADTVVQTYLETQREYQEDMSPQSQLQEAIESGALNGEDIHQLLRNAVASARNGWQRKPF